MLRALLRTATWSLCALLVLALAALWWLSEGFGGERHARGAIAPERIPADQVARRHALQGPSRPEESGEAGQILFGDLHVHTTYSGDAFAFSLPLLQGEGVHPPADACDFARFCAELDFWSINDHAEHITPWQWRESRQAIRECNAVAGDPANPDLVSFLGWEWTQSAPQDAPAAAGRTHYGHKNVILLGTADAEVPSRPIGAGRGGLFDLSNIPGPALALARAAMTLGDWPDGLQPYLDFNRYSRDVRALDACPADTAVRELPDDCLEGAETPEALFRKLDDWGFPSLVIPHGSAWGVHAPLRADWRDQLAPARHDPLRQRLFEVYSGHGSSELWRPLHDVVTDADGRARCAEPSDAYEPCCWRAGEIIRERCGAVAASQCEERVQRARQSFVDAGPGARAFRVVPGAVPADWRDCGQLAGTFLPAFDYRPRMSAQYALALAPPAGGAALRTGFVGSSDNHKARSGAGYKEIGRKAFGDAYGLRQDWIDRLADGPEAASPQPRAAAELGGNAVAGLRDPGTERNASFYYTGGLAAVHALGRDRQAIWQALNARRSYGTSGPRILLWFALENAGDAPAPMGSEVELQAPPRFRVHAVGAFEQRPGCPEHTRARLSPERLARLCLDECYHPGDRRHPIEAIEVVRIRRQLDPEDPLDPLIEDPWRRFACNGERAGCTVHFEDPDWRPEREHVYYVRALQAPTPAVNGDPMRCVRDERGRCVEARPCPAGGPDFAPEDDCLGAVRERAWSSPIWVRGTPQAGRGDGGGPL